jgi:hexosaminidase
MALLGAAAPAAFGQVDELLPRPAEVESLDGELVIDGAFRVEVEACGDARVGRAAERFVGRLARQTGLVFFTSAGEHPAPPALRVRCGAGAPHAPTWRTDESYRLEIGRDGAILSAPAADGVLRGLETFLQLVAPGPKGFRAPGVRIADRPRFPWRGLLLDCARHFMPQEIIERNLDGMAAAKLNVLHWHLTDDQGFRVESRTFPRLHQMGSDGLFYTQEQVRQVIAYARDRGIRVVPEFDMPGHTTAWLAGHPELAALPGPYSIERKWGIFDPTLDPTRDDVYHFLDRFLGEMARLFPDEYIHIGGDEVNGKAWNASPRVAAFKQEHGFSTNEQVQAYFNGQVARILTRHGKKMVGWDEILHADLPKDIVIQSWRGQAPLAKGAREGRMGLLSFGYYLDHVSPAAAHYAVDPLAKEAAALTPEEAARVLGGEACMWSEYVSPETVDSRLWPRLLAVAERLWSPADVTDVDDYYRRAESFSARLDFLGLQHRSGLSPMLERLAGTSPPPPALRELAAVVEPVKQYVRGKTSPHTSRTPLNRLVDAARPESLEARDFRKAVDAFLADPSRAARREEVRRRLDRWRRLDAELQPWTARSFLLAEIAPLSRALADLATAGLEALEIVASRGKADPAWWEFRRGVLDAPKRPAHALEIAALPAVRRLMEAARDGS